MDRIAWACPKCGRRFAIPADSPAPERCPDCADDDDAIDLGLETELPTAPPLRLLDDHRERSPQRLLLARMLVMTFRILGGIALIGALAALITGVVTVAANEPGAERSSLIWISLAWFGGAVFSGLMMLGAAEGLSILIQMNDHSRRHPANREES